MHVVGWWMRSYAVRVQYVYFDLLYVVLLQAVLESRRKRIVLGVQTVSRPN